MENGLGDPHDLWVPLELADLVVTYPKGTRSPTDFATDLQNQRIPLGVIEAPYIIYVSGGRVLKGEATDKTSEKILREYTGLEPFDSKPFKNGDERDAFYMRGTVAEMAIAGFNPVTEPYIRAGRLRPVVGNLLIDEKAGDHQAFGSNDIFGGTTPSSYKGEHVEHTDFIGSIQRRLELLR